MPKVHKLSNRTPRASFRHSSKRGKKSAAPTASPNALADITPERYPKMSRSAIAFARQMCADPHIQAVMRDLADK